MSDTQHAGPGAPTPRIHLPYGNPCEENVRRKYSVSLARDLWQFRSLIPPEIMPPSQVQRLAAILCADLKDKFEEGFPVPLQGLSQSLFMWQYNTNQMMILVQEKNERVRGMARQYRKQLAQHYKNDWLFHKRQRKIEKEKVFEELRNPEVSDFLERHHRTQFHETYEPRLPELVASIELDNEPAVLKVQINRDLAPLLDKFPYFCMYAEPKRVDKLVATLLNTLMDKEEAIRSIESISLRNKTIPNTSSYDRNKYVQQLLTITSNYLNTLDSPWRLAPPQYLDTRSMHWAGISPLRNAKYQFIVDHARRYGRNKGRRLEAYYVLCSAIKRRALRHTYTARPTANLCVIRRPMDDRPCPLRLLAGSNEILCMIARLAYPV